MRSVLSSAYHLLSFRSSGLYSKDGLVFKCLSFVQDCVSSHSLSGDALRASNIQYRQNSEMAKLSLCLINLLKPSGYFTYHHV